MIKALGGTLVLGSCFWWAQHQMGSLRQQAEILEALAETLAHMARELDRCAPEMETLLQLGLEEEHETVRQLFGSISLGRLGEQRFETLWRDSVEASNVPEAGKRILCPLGAVLGRYDREAQIAALSGAQTDLREAGAALRRKLSENRKLWYTLSLSTGLMVVLMFL